MAKSERPSYLVDARSEWFVVKDCRRCGKRVLSGWHEGKFSVFLDLAPLTPIGEAIAILAGIDTYWLSPRLGGAMAYWRSPAHLWADAHRPRPIVLPEHQCKE